MELDALGAFLNNGIKFQDSLEELNHGVQFATKISVQEKYPIMLRLVLNQGSQRIPIYLLHFV